MGAERFADLPSGCKDGIKRKRGVLGNQRNLTAANRAQFAFRQSQ